MDKYSLISLLPSLAIVAAMIVATGVAVKLIKREMAADAKKAENSQ